MGFGKISWKGVIQIRWDGEAYPLSGGKNWSTGNGKEVIMSRMDYKSDLRFAGMLVHLLTLRFRVYLHHIYIFNFHCL